MKKFLILFCTVVSVFLAALAVSADEIYTRDGNKIYFGSYPQSKVTDTATIAALNEKAGTLPTSSNSQAWTDYGYYANYEIKSFMWYIDIEQDGEKYRGVYFISYRSSWCSLSGTSSDSYQDDNGFFTNNIYWFQYEPVSWTILSENDNKALILCDMIIDSQPVDYKENDIYLNNYAESTIRKWLNETFYCTAFNDLEKQIILTTTVNNGEESTGIASNPYVCEDTEDKVFLLSYEEATTYLPTDALKTKKPTQYAQSQNAYVGESSNGYWWLRSPGTSKNTPCVRNVFDNGRISDWAVDITFDGVVPALVIDTSEKEDTSPMEIFTFKGYSVGPDGKSLCAGYDIDYDKINSYEGTLEFGAVFTLYDALGGQSPLNSETGEVNVFDKANVVKANISDFGYLTYEFKIIDIDDSFKDYALVIAGYVYNGEKVIYCQDNGYSQNVTSVSYNEIAKGLY
ncbi:MAG: hypothetical protein J6B45_02620 [Clostridia bacterium]|nr:hypothetical protein [Clostridia bacterium]